MNDITFKLSAWEPGRSRTSPRWTSRSAVGTGAALRSHRAEFHGLEGGGESAGITLKRDRGPAAGGDP